MITDEEALAMRVIAPRDRGAFDETWGYHILPRELWHSPTFTSYEGLRARGLVGLCHGGWQVLTDEGRAALEAYEARRCRG